MTFLMSTSLVVGMLLLLSAIDDRTIADEWNALITGQSVGTGGSNVAGIAQAILSKLPPGSKDSGSGAGSRTTR